MASRSSAQTLPAVGTDLGIIRPIRGLSLYGQHTMFPTKHLPGSGVLVLSLTLDDATAECERLSGVKFTSPRVAGANSAYRIIMGEGGERYVAVGHGCTVVPAGRWRQVRVDTRTEIGESLLRDLLLPSKGQQLVMYTDDDDSYLIAECWNL